MKGYGAGARMALAGLVALVCAGAARPNLSAVAATPARSQAEPEAPLDTPTTIIANSVTEYTLAAPKLFWRELQNVSCDPDLHTKTARDLVKRVALQGSTKRTLYDRTFDGNTCSSQITSNVVADDDYLYWATETALVKLPTNAIIQTNPVTVTTAVAGGTGLVLTLDAVYALTPSGGIRKTLKATGASSVLVSAGNVGASPSNFQTDGVYVY